MKDNKILGAQVVITDYDLIALPRDVLDEKIESELTISLAREMVKSKAVTITEEPDFMTKSKRIRAEVVVLDKDEYARLKRIERKAKELGEIALLENPFCCI